MGFRLIPLAGLMVLGTALATLGGEHPVALEKDADCASCHEEKTKGKAVHSVIAMGCPTCHEVKTENETTTVNLVSPKEELCLTCHTASDDPVKHGPYQKGQCVACHDPHVSEFPKQLRAPTNTLCFACHGSNQPAVKFDREAKLVTLFDTQPMSFDDYRAAPKLGLDRGGNSGHPMPGHPLSGTDPKSKQPISCLTCHQPHSSKLEALMPSEVKNDLELCARCH